MPNQDEDETARLMEELAEWASSARLRGFAPRLIVSALASAGLVALEGSGVTHAQAVDVVDYHYGEGVHERPTVQA